MFIYSSGSVEQYNIQLDTAYLPLPANPELSGVTAQDCRDRCYQDLTCNSFSFNSGQGNCYIWRDIRGVTLSQSFGYNHYTKETIAQATGKYRKAPKFLATRKLCCNTPKIQTKRQNLRVFRQKMQMEMQTVKTLIRLLFL